MNSGKKGQVERKKPMKRIRNILSNSMRILLLVFLFFPFVQMLIQNPFPYYGFGLFTVVSGSMEPTIPTGSIVFVRPVTKTQIKEGDILTFQGKNAGIFTHRLVSVTEGIKGTVYVTKGDANITLDEPMTEDRIIGRVQFWIGGIGWMVSFMKYPPVIIWTVAIILVIFFIIKGFFSPKDKDDIMRIE